jgi:hypothetical protein
LPFYYDLSESEQWEVIQGLYDFTDWV